MSNDERFNEEERLEQLAARLRELPGEAEPARDLWPGIAMRIAARGAHPAQRPGRGRILLRVAAALAIFAGGVVVGRGSVARPAEPPLFVKPLQTAAEVQRAGSEYVAALVSLETVEDREARRQGREAAISALYGAAHELSRISPDDPGASRILEAVSRTRQTRPASRGGEPGTRTVNF